MDSRADEFAGLQQRRKIVDRRDMVGLRPMTSASFAYSAFFVSITLTFPAYFYFLPESEATDIRPFLLIIYLIAWPLAIVVPSVLLVIRPMTQWAPAFDVLYLTAALLWPVATAAIKIRSAVLWGDPGIDYWAVYPVFILIELVWPLFVVGHWAWVRILNTEARGIRRELRREIERTLRDSARFGARRHNDERTGNGGPEEREALSRTLEE